MMHSSTPVIASDPDGLEGRPALLWLVTITQQSSNQSKVGVKCNLCDKSFAGLTEDGGSLIQETRLPRQQVHESNPLKLPLLARTFSKRTTLDTEPPGRGNCYTRNPRGSGNYR